jgi:hypothetical protein
MKFLLESFIETINRSTQNVTKRRAAQTGQKKKKKKPTMRRSDKTPTYASLRLLQATDVHHHRNVFTRSTGRAEKVDIGQIGLCEKRVALSAREAKKKRRSKFQEPTNNTPLRHCKQYFTYTRSSRGTGSLMLQTIFVSWRVESLSICRCADEKQKRKKTGLLRHDFFVFTKHERDRSTSSAFNQFQYTNQLFSIKKYNIFEKK